MGICKRTRSKTTAWRINAVRPGGDEDGSTKPVRSLLTGVQTGTDAYADLACPG